MLRLLAFGLFLAAVSLAAVCVAVVVLSLMWTPQAAGKTLG